MIHATRTATNSNGTGERNRRNVTAGELMTPKRTGRVPVEALRRLRQPERIEAAPRRRRDRQRRVRHMEHARQTGNLPGRVARCDVILDLDVNEITGAHRVTAALVDVLDRH